MKRSVTVMLLAMCVTLMSGCATQPSRSQTQTFEDCTFNVIAPAAVAKTAPAIQSECGDTIPAGFAVGDILTQNMMIENSGTENNTASSSPTVTTPIDVSWGGAAASTASGFMSGVSALYNSIKGADKTAKNSSATTVKPSPGSCTDGSCTPMSAPSSSVGVHRYTASGRQTEAERQAIIKARAALEASK